MWQILECRTGALLGEGDRLIWRSDVAVQRNETEDGKAFIPKTIELSPPFTLQMAEFPVPSRQDMVGFGLAADKTDIHTFCWEWFVMQDNLALNQEGARLEIEAQETALGWQVSRTTFLSDASLKITAFGDVDMETLWQVNILNGSHIEWPVDVA